MWFYIGLGIFLILVGLFACMLIPSLSNWYFRCKMGLLALIAVGFGIFVMVQGPKIAADGESYQAHHARLTKDYRHALSEMKENTHDQVKYNYWNAQAQNLKQQLDNRD